MMMILSLMLLSIFNFHITLTARVQLTEVDAQKVLQQCEKSTNEDLSKNSVYSTADKCRAEVCLAQNLLRFIVKAKVTVYSPDKNDKTAPWKKFKIINEKLFALDTSSKYLLVKINRFENIIPVERTAPINQDILYGPNELKISFFQGVVDLMSSGSKGFSIGNDEKKYAIGQTIKKSIFGCMDANYAGLLGLVAPDHDDLKGTAPFLDKLVPASNEKVVAIWIDKAFKDRTKGVLGIGDDLRACHGETIHVPVAEVDEVFANETKDLYETSAALLVKVNQVGILVGDDLDITTLGYDNTDQSGFVTFDAAVPGLFLHEKIVKDYLKVANPVFKELKFNETDLNEDLSWKGETCDKLRKSLPNINFKFEGKNADDTKGFLMTPYDYIHSFNKSNVPKAILDKGFGDHCVMMIRKNMGLGSSLGVPFFRKYFVAFHFNWKKKVELGDSKPTC